MTNVPHHAFPADRVAQVLHELCEEPAFPRAQAEPGGHEDHAEEGHQRIRHRILPGGILVRAYADRRGEERRGGRVGNGQGVCREPYSGVPH